MKSGEIIEFVDEEIKLEVEFMKKIKWAEKLQKKVAD